MIESLEDYKREKKKVEFKFVVQSNIDSTFLTVKSIFYPY